MIHEVPGTAIRFYLREEYDTDLIVVNEIWQENVYEVNSGRFSPNGIVVDIGANIGTFSVFAACQGAIVYAVEPEPNNTKSLLKNIDLNRMNSRIIHLPYAISDKKGIANISDEGGGSTIKDDWKLGTEVETMSLDSLFELYDIDSVDVLKIDVEVAEKEIILGASRETLQKCKYITAEIDIRSGNKLGEMTQKLSETHHVRTMGSWERGGMIFAWLYQCVQASLQGLTTLGFDKSFNGSFGIMVEKLARQFGLEILGSPERGGYIYANKYKD